LYPVDALGGILFDLAEVVVGGLRKCALGRMTVTKERTKVDGKYPMPATTLPASTLLILWPWVCWVKNPVWLRIGSTFLALGLLS
jgi:hypothetical protein